MAYDHRAHRIALAVLTWLSLLAVTPLRAQQVAISGVVLDSAGTPVEGAVVLVEPAGRSSLTDARGWFEVTGVGPGRMRVEVRRIGFEPHRESVILEPGASIALDIGLRASARVLAAVVVLAERRGLRGVVHDGSLRPLAGARIEILGTSHRLRSGADGSFAVPSLRPGSYMLRVQLEGFAARAYGVHLARGEGKELSITLTPALHAESHMERQAWDDFGRRQRWRGSRSLFYTRDDLLGFGLTRLADLPGVLQLVGTSPCIYVDGRLTGLTLHALLVDDAEAVELYPLNSVSSAAPGTPGASFRATTSMSRGAPPPAGRNCARAVLVWRREAM